MQTTTRGVFDHTENAVYAAKKAWELYHTFSQRDRDELVCKLREGLLPHAEILAEMEAQETGMGVAADKALQIRRAIAATPGAGDIRQESSSDEEGIFLRESFPYGVACAAHPVNHPVASVINSCIMLISVGNSVINLLPKRAQQVCKYTIDLINGLISEICGLNNLMVCMADSRYEYNRTFMEHPDISLVLVTGGRDIVSAALVSRKRVIAAGNANPVVLVDEDCDLASVASMIAEDVSFDNNLLCTSEKTAVVHSGIFSDFVLRLVDNRAQLLDAGQVQRLEQAVFDPDLRIRKEFVGKSAAHILETVGIPCYVPGVKLITFEAEVINPFVIHEVAAPILPLVKADSFEEAVKLARYAEQGCHHSASIHSKNIDRLSYASRQLQTAVFIKNGSTLYGAGIKGNVPVTFTIANVTGEGPVTPAHLVRGRLCALLNTWRND